MDKLLIINRALSATGNGTLLVGNDGSDESNAAEMAFNRAIDFMMAFEFFPFTTKLVDMVRVGDSPMPPFLHAMQYPPDCWHLKAVKDATYDFEHAHRIVNGQILTLVDTNIKAFYLTRPAATMTWHPAATEALTLLVEAELYQGLNEDLTSAKDKRGQAEEMMMRASGRVNQEDSARNTFKSRTAIARRTRKV